MEPINLIWTAPDWEIDWIKELFKKVEFNLIFDTQFKTITNNSVLIINNINEKVIENYISKFLKKNYHIGVIQFGDEHYNRPMNYYKKVSFVLRNYYHDKFSQYNNVYHFPLGYKKGFCNDNQLQLQSANKRKYLWNFIGLVIGRKTRPEMISQAIKLPYGFVYTTNKWGEADQKSMPTDEYREVLTNSTFTLAPFGWSTPDTYRLYEALEVGSIPIVEYSNGYFNKLLGTKNPIPFVNQWSDLPNLINSMHGKENKLQKKCIYWWKKYKKGLQKKIRKLVRENFNI